MIRVLLVDDNEVFRTGMRTLLSTFADIAVIAEAGSGQDAIAKVESHLPDVALMDLRMPGIDGIGATGEIVRRFPTTRVLVVTTFDEDDLVREALSAGAFGYVLKAMPSEDLADIIRLCSRGYSIFGAETVSFRKARKELTENPRLPTDVVLSDRELDILRLLGHGLRNREIAEELHLSHGTVRNYISLLLTRLRAKHRTELALAAEAILARTKLR